MLTLEQLDTPADQVLAEAVEQPEAAEGRRQWLEAFYQNTEVRMLNLFDSARRRIYD
jgi:hypothetical protein